MVDEKKSAFKSRNKFGMRDKFGSPSKFGILRKAVSRKAVLFNFDF
jgi:hypothetical protein